MNQKIKIGAAVGLCAAVAIGSLLYLKKDSEELPVRQVHDQETELAAQRRAEELLSQGKVDEALAIIHPYEDQLNLKTESSRQWFHLLIEANIQATNFGRLIVLYEAYPAAFDNNEQASIMIADGYLLAMRPQDYQKIRKKWEKKATLVDIWLVLDTDAMLQEGKREEALKLLRSKKFEGKKDVERLVRLALLYIAEDPKMAWDYLGEAYSLDPENPTIITYRGKLLEGLGKDSLALYEYLAAVQAAPNNLFLRDQLAEFYMRRNQVALALSIWLETLSRPSLDLIWIKTLFWSKAVTPISVDWSKASPPIGSDKPFIEYLISLPKGVFWDERAFQKVPDAKKILVDKQASFWLRLLQALKEGNEKEALNLLQFNNFSQNILNPQLEKGLQQILRYRISQSLSDAKPSLDAKEDAVQEGKSGDQKSPPPIDSAISNSPTFFDQLNALAKVTVQNDGTQKLPQDIHDLLLSKDAFSAMFLAAGWLEAALQLQTMPVLPDTFPEWVAYGMTQALRTNRSPADALEFALKQKKTPALTVLIGELYMADKKPDEALAVLEPYLADTSLSGYRASWLASLIYTEMGEYQKAKEIIQAQPKLAENVLGKEALARIALLEGDPELAYDLYAQLEDQSPEAMSYLARKAFAEKNWKRAQELTEKLLMMFPDNPTLRENLNQVMKEQTP